MGSPSTFDKAFAHQAEDVRAQLSRAWEFLSGEARNFRHMTLKPDVLQFAEFSFFLPLTDADLSRSGGVGVLVQREDAARVATHMFGVARGQVTEADLRDACAEVCNVLSDCMAPLFSEGHGVLVGLPLAASSAEYGTIAEHSVARAIYQGRAGPHRVRVVLYDSRSQTAQA